MEMQAGVVIGGMYRHYKGFDYRVICVAWMEATHEACVVYEALYENPVHQKWIRPVTEFLEEVEFEGKRVKRFEWVEIKK